jgi:hypothetical protein
VALSSSDCGLRTERKNADFLPAYFLLAVAGMCNYLIVAAISERFFGAKVAPQSDILFRSYLIGAKALCVEPDKYAALENL